MKKTFDSISAYREYEVNFWQSDWLSERAEHVNRRFEDRVLHAATVRDEVRRGVRISDEDIEVTMYAWLQRFLYYSPRYHALDAVVINGITGRIVFDLFERTSQFEPLLSAEDFWQSYRAQLGADVSYSAWSYGSSRADRLARLTAQGVKSATSSLHLLYALDGEALPEVGEYSIILYTDNHVSCLVRTTDVTIVPFKDVGRAHALLEGEGDRSLRFWQIGHHVFFNQALKPHGKTFNEDMLVVCERYQLISRPFDLFCDKLNV